MVGAERPRRQEDPNEPPEIRGAREGMFPSDAVDLAYLTYLEYLEGGHFQRIRTLKELLSELGNVVHSLDALIQYYGYPAYESGGSYEGPVSELSLDAKREGALIVARTSSHIIVPQHFELASKHAVRMPLSPNVNAYFAIVNVPNGEDRTNPDMPAHRGVSLFFRNEGNRLGPHRIVEGVIMDEREMHIIGVEGLNRCAPDAGRIFDKILKEDFPRVMPK